MTELGNFETCGEIELAVSDYFGTRTHIIVPNVSWGLFGYELDMCILNEKSMYASEVEIKISKADLKRDGKKWHKHEWNYGYIRQLWFAMPEKMECCTEFVPIDAGVILVDKKGKVRIVRKPKPNVNAKKWPIEQALKLARLGTMRIWNLKWANHWLSLNKARKARVELAEKQLDVNTLEKMMEVQS